MEIKVIGGREATNRSGAAERLEMPINTVRMYSSPSQRPKTGWPEPLSDRINDQDWFALDDLDAYRVRREGVPVEAPAVDDPDRLIGAAEFAALRAVELKTFKRYVELSLDDWEAGRPAYLPRPTATRPARPNGHVYEWRMADASAWAFPAKRRTSSGRPPGRRPGTADLRRVLTAAADRGETPTSRQIAALLSEEFGRVSLQTVHRLKRQMRDEDNKGI